MRHILGSLSAQGRAARDDHGVSRPRQLLELLILRAGRGKLRADDYYKLRVYRDDLRFSEKRQYISNSALPRSVFGRWAVIADDKLLTYSVLSDAGIAVPLVHAICHDIRRYRDRPTLKSVAEIAEYLRTGAPYPLIAKPIGGIYSAGVYLLNGVDTAADTVLVEGDGPLAVEELATRLRAEKSGYLFQDLLRPHERVRHVIGERLCTLRVITLLERSQARLFMAVWKINVGANVADNYWRTGNLLARLDQGTGTILQCMTGLGPNYRTVERHPRTDREFAGFQVPLYREAIDLALQASRSFPGVPMQAWDIAITDRGALPLELNVAGSLFIPQLVSQQGLWAGPFLAYLRDLRSAQ